LAATDDDDAASHLFLRLRHANDQAVQFHSDFDLAAQAAVGLAFGRGGVEHGVLIVINRREQWQKFFVNVNMAGSAQAGPTAFTYDSVDPVLDCALHDRLADGPVDLRAFPLMRYISDLWHNGMSLYYR
jgi:hypothetical protein